ncbi:siderophore biosynthesis protein SbnG [Paenibacillus alba]|uniref:HpcH/HpaI aldolase family protein n=1 Tax=Paenibacillus alba TaxID=1197127 RepID=UPI001563EC31|nr:aldolase/citrate lyase family protein [Paenibacillus alba]NQX69113.1 siderophore biosynthesis protein SbnG [Paenibacillus alba]
MLKENTLKQKLKNGIPVFGLLVSIPSPLVVEMIGCADYDFIIIDNEHVQVNPETLEHMIRAAEAVDLIALVRVSEPNAKEILRALDAGALGIVVPQVESREQMEQIVRSCKYAPLGNRSLNSGRAGIFGKNDLAAYVQRANEEIMVVPMIETRAGVEQVHDILSVPGVDMVLEGAADLSQSYGIPWQTRHPVVKEALRQVSATAKQCDVPYCAIPRAPEDFTEWTELGIQAFVLGDERGVAFRALKAHLQGFVQS